MTKSLNIIIVLVLLIWINNTGFSQESKSSPRNSQPSLSQSQKNIQPELGTMISIAEEGDTMFKYPLGMYFKFTFLSRPSVVDLYYWKRSLSIASETNTLVSFFQTFPIFNSEKFNARLGFSFTSEYYKIKHQTDHSRELGFNLGGLLGIDYTFIDYTNLNLKLFYSGSIFPSPLTIYLLVVDVKNIFGLSIGYKFN